MQTYFFVAKIRIQTALAYRFNVFSTILIQYEITAARLIEDISRTVPIKEVGLEEAKIDDIIRTVYKQGSSVGQ